MGGRRGPQWPLGVCWSRRALQGAAGQGAGVNALVYILVTTPRQPKAVAGSSLMR